MHRTPKRIDDPRARPRRARTIALLAALLAVAIVTYAGDRVPVLFVGRQADGSFIVSTQQRIVAGSIAFNARPSDIAVHPSGAFAAVLNQGSVLLVNPTGVVPRSRRWLDSAASFRGMAWSPDGSRLYVSVAKGYVQEIALRNGRLELTAEILVKPAGVRANPRPGGMAITRNGQRLFVALADRNAIAEIDLTTRRLLREYKTQNLPFEVKLSADESTLVATNWGGRIPTRDDGDDVATSAGALVVVDPRGAASTGAVSLIRRATGETRTLRVGLHPTAIAVDGDHAYITNSASDSLTEVNVRTRRVVGTIPLTWAEENRFGSMPCAIAVHNGTAYVANGGDNAICVVDLKTERVKGYVPAGFYPTAIVLDKAGRQAYVLNTKGNGSVREAGRGVPLNVHQFQGTVTMVDLSADLAAATRVVAANNGWDRSHSYERPNLPVYHGAIKHVLYIIKENRSYDEVLGDLPQGNGDKRLCILGETLTPNHHALARQFTLFDNAYVAGTNSADGHQWCTQAIANDYVERFYSSFRTFSFDGSCPMAVSSSGCLWDAALKKGLTIRDYGEFCDAKRAVITPPVKSWNELWSERAQGKHTIQVRAGTAIRSLKPYIHPRVLCWPLFQSDQERADLFIADFQRMSRTHTVPNLMILSLPCDHTEGRNPGYPQPQCMIADNDLALGRVVDAVSHSSQWKDTCIFVIEDDTQYGLDHVDGHRTVYYALSAYTRRGYVDHELCNTVSMIRSIEMMLGIPPMNRFDALAQPITGCFSSRRDLSPYAAVRNQIALDIMNPPLRAQAGPDRDWTERSMALDWSEPDRADPQTLSRVIWHSVCGQSIPFPDP